MDIRTGNDGEVRVYFAAKETETIAGLEETFRDLKVREVFEGSQGQIFSNIMGPDSKFLLAGIGEKQKASTESLRRSAYAAGKEVMKLKEKSLQLILPELESLSFAEIFRSIIEGFLYSEYSFDKYLKEKKTKPTVENVYIDVTKDLENEARQMIDETTILLDSVFLARDLVNDPSMAMTPAALSEVARSRLEKVGVKVTIWGRDKIEEMGMGAFLAVTQGSDQEPRFIIMEYHGDPGSARKLAMVGKGIMFDSGGYSLKPPKSMETMFDDMAGAASVIGAMEAIAKSGLKKNVVAVVAACENLISGSAYKPGDIIKSMSGKTIEIFSTDAEGRLTLADALYYTVRELNPDKVIDVATLTGACVVALGHYATGAVTNNQDFMQEVKAAGDLADELIWELPNTPDYRELNKGYFADLRNTTENAGAIGAGLFLSEFVEDTPWVHLDIAGTAYLSSEKGYLPKGATGIPVKTLYYLTKRF